MEDVVREAYDGNRNFGNKAFRSGCYAPFVSLYFNTFGDVLACCKNETFLLGNVLHDRLDDIWNGGKIRELRQALRNYNFKMGCEVCEWQIMGGHGKGALASIFEDFPVQSMDPEWPAQMEFAGSNSCNFECIMCYGELSSSIRSNREGLPPLPKVYLEQFFTDLRKFLPHLRQVKFLGGEPFFTQECFRIWDMMIEDGLSIPCHVTTNGSQFNAKVARVLEALPISLSISVDGVTKHTVEKIRINSHHETLIANIHQFRTYTRQRGTYFGFAHCLMQQNWQEFGDLLLFADELDCDVFVNTVIDPPHCSLYKLPVQDLARVVDEMEAQGTSLQLKLGRNRQVWDDNLQKLRANVSEQRAEQLTKVLDDYYFGPQASHFTTADALFEKGLYREALDEALKVPETHPYYYRVVVLCARTSHLLDDLEGAEENLARAITLSRRRPEAYITRAWIRLEQNRLAEGLEDALHARELITEGDDFEPQVCEVLNALYKRQGKVSESLTVLDRWQDLQPQNPKVRVQRGEVFLLADLRDQAFAEVEIALALEPNNVETLRLKERIETL